MRGEGSIAASTFSVSVLSLSRVRASLVKAAGWQGPAAWRPAATPRPRRLRPGPVRAVKEGGEGVHGAGKDAGAGAEGECVYIVRLA